MNNKEPLLKEEVETFGFLRELEKDKKKSKDKTKEEKKALIMTIILCVVVGLFSIKWIRAFYIGFKYFNEGRIVESNKTPEEEKEEDVSLNSYVVVSALENIKVSSDLLNKLFLDREVIIANLDSVSKLSMLLNSFVTSCDNTYFSLSLEQLEDRALELFNDKEMLRDLENLSDVGSFNIVREDNVYNITLSVCDMEALSTKKATYKNSELYIYENVQNGGISKEYKMTFRKEDGNYYLFSIKPI